MQSESRERWGWEECNLQQKLTKKRETGLGSGREEGIPRPCLVCLAPAKQAVSCPL